MSMSTLSDGEALLATDRDTARAKTPSAKGS